MTIGIKNSIVKHITCAVLSVVYIQKNSGDKPFFFKLLRQLLRLCFTGHATEPQHKLCRPSRWLDHLRPDRAVAVED